MSRSPIEPVTVASLLRASDRNGFVYFERSIINRESNAITAISEKGTVHIPAASIGTLILGPGTSITQQAILLLAESGTCVIWSGEQGVRYYAHGRGGSESTRYLERQARLVSNTQSRLAVARSMYDMRFPGEDVSTDSMQQLRGKEGTRVKRVYAEAAKKHKVQWDGRQYTENDWDNTSPINQALSVATSCLYGVCHAVIVALGCSPGLGFVHTGHSRSFVYDIADLYKTQTAIPVAFGLAESVEFNLESKVRTRMRDVMHEQRLMQKIVSDISILFSMNSNSDTSFPTDSRLLWDEYTNTVEGGVSYGEESP